MITSEQAIAPSIATWLDEAELQLYTNLLVNICEQRMQLTSCTPNEEKLGLYFNYYINLIPRRLPQHTELGRRIHHNIFWYYIAITLRVSPEICESCRALLVTQDVLRHEVDIVEYLGYCAPCRAELEARASQPVLDATCRAAFRAAVLEATSMGKGGGHPLACAGGIADLAPQALALATERRRQQQRVASAARRSQQVCGACSALVDPSQSPHPRCQALLAEAFQLLLERSLYDSGIFGVVHR